MFMSITYFLISNILITSTHRSVWQKKLTLIIIVLIGVISCVGNKLKNERALFIQKLEAFNFLSKYHHQLHIMIGEDEEM